MSEVRDQPTIDDKDDKKRSRSSTKKVLAEAQERFEAVVAGDKENKQAAAEDTSFVYVSGSQWPEKIIKARRDADEACLEFPQLKQFVNQVVNDQRQNRPGIRIHPAGSDASKETAEVLQGLIRGIEYASNAEAAYDTGFQHAVVGGRGYWRVCADYERPDSFNQNLKIERIADPSTVWLDPHYQEPDGSDRTYAFVTESVTRDEFEQRWPKAKALDWEDGPDRWYTAEEEVIVADYYRRVTEDDELLMLSDGSTAYLSDMPAGQALPPGVTVVNRRSTQRYKVEWFKVAGGEQILEEYDWEGTIIPVICCSGDEIIVEGKRHYYGLIRQARDAQRMYNYEQSAKVMRLALAPKAPWVAPVEAIAGYEGVWETANKLSHSYLPYNHRDAAGDPLPAPSRTAPAPMESGWIDAANQSKADMKSVIGMYENSLGLHGQETSGRAILAREKQGDNSTFHFVDNLSRAIALTGRILVELIPHYYDTHRIVTVVGIDDTRRQVEVNKPMPAPVDGAIQAVLENNVTEGQYAVTVEAGPSYATKRQETADKLAQLVQSFPPIMQVAGDVLVGAMDLPDADAIAERLKIMLPPPVQQMLAAKEQGENPEMAQMQAQIQQIQQQAQQAVQGLQAQVQALQQSQHDKIQAAQIGADTDLLKARIDAAVKLEIAQIQATAKAQIDANAQALGGQPNEDMMRHQQMMEIMQQLAEQFAQMNQQMNAPQSMTLQYDEQGNPTAAVGDRHVTQFQYDAAGNPVGATRSPRTTQ